MRITNLQIDTQLADDIVDRERRVDTRFHGDAGHGPDAVRRNELSSCVCPIGLKARRRRHSESRCGLVQGV